MAGVESKYETKEYISSKNPLAKTDPMDALENSVGDFLTELSL